MERYANARQLAQNIKRVRKIKGLSQKDVADKMHVSRTLITAYESGSVYPPNLSALADAMGVDVKELILLDPLEHGIYESLTDDLLKIAWLMDDKTTTVVVRPSLRQIDAANPTPEPRHTLNERERAYVSKQLMTLVDVIDLFALKEEENGTGNNTQETDIDRGN